MAHGRHQRSAHDVLGSPGIIEQQREVDVEDAARVLGPLDIASDPVQRLRDAAQHGCPPAACCLLLLPAAVDLHVDAVSGAGSGPWRSGGGTTERARDAPLAGEHPGVLRAAALAGVDDQRALDERHPGQAAGQHPHVVAVVHGERPQVDVARGDAVADQRRDGRQLHHRLRDPSPRISDEPRAQHVQLVTIGLRADDEALATGAVDRLDARVRRAGRAPPPARRAPRGARCRRSAGPAPRGGSSGSGQAGTCRSACRRRHRCRPRSRCVTFPARAAVSRPGQPSVDSARNCTGSRNSSSTRR